MTCHKSALGTMNVRVFVQDVPEGLLQHAGADRFVDYSGDEGVTLYCLRRAWPKAMPLFFFGLPDHERRFCDLHLIQARIALVLALSIKEENGPCPVLKLFKKTARREVRMQSQRDKEMVNA